MTYDEYPPIPTKADRVQAVADCTVCFGHLAIADAMHKAKVRPSELAKRLGVSRPYVSNLLKGENLTLRQLARVLYALGYGVLFELIPLSTPKKPKP